MNINGYNSNCSNCQESVILGKNSLGMILYGCKYMGNICISCTNGITLFNEIEQARKIKEKESDNEK